jgi:hypothetical protein
MGDALINQSTGDPRLLSDRTGLPRNRKRQLPLQKQLGESRQTHEGETSKLGQGRIQTIMKPGQFSMEIPGQISAKINIVGSFSRTTALRRAA